jgi:ribosomal protein S18 acetylase RimI-like enzyme
MTSQSQSFVVRPCRMRDVSRIGALLEKSWHDTYDRILGRPQAIRMGRRAYSKINLGILIAHSIWPFHRWTVLVAAQDREIIGCVVADRDDEVAEIILYGLYVDPELKRKGIGSALLDAVIAKYPHAKAFRLEVLRDNTAAITWYKARGFAIYGETKKATGTTDVPALYMEKRIDRSPGRSS